jgi:putative transport protein
VSKEVAGHAIGEFRQHPEACGIFLKGIRRGAETIPIAPGTVLRRGDLLSIHALEPAVKRVSARVGNIPGRLPTQTSSCHDRRLAACRSDRRARWP